MGSEKLLFRLEQPHGSGEVYVAWQKGSGNYLATTGINSTINIYDRHGQLKEKIALQGLCNGFAWDSDGDLLGVISQSSQLLLWDANTSNRQLVDIGLRDSMTCIFWAKKKQIVAIATAKGNVSIYNYTTSKRIPVIGKHSKKITCGCWNAEDLLALGSEDKTLTINNVEGETLRQVTLRSEPAEIQFSEMKLDERVGVENTVSLIVGKRTLYLYNMYDPENPVELAFQQHYGSIVTYKWFGDGYILIGFSNGYFVAISTHIKEVGQELFQVKNHKSNLTDIAICNAIESVASCGDNTVKIHEMGNLQETASVITLAAETGVERVDWSADGQLLSVCTRNGSVNVYVSHMPILASICGRKIAVLSSLAEVSIYTFATDTAKLKPVPVMLESEPNFIGVGQFHLAVGMNTRVWFYDLTKPNPKVDDAILMIRDRQYLGTVSNIQLNAEYASVLYEGKVQLHVIEQSPNIDEERESIIFPDINSPNVIITCHALTSDFLIYATDMGEITYFCIDDWSVAMKYKHTVGVTRLFSDITGTRSAFIDSKNQGFVYSAVSNNIVPIPDLPTLVSGIIWDSNIIYSNSSYAFIVYDNCNVFTYVYSKMSIQGPTVECIGKTSLTSKQVPVFMYNGDVLLAIAGGLLTHSTLSTHDYITSELERDHQTLEAALNKELKLHNYKSATALCRQLKSKLSWKKLADAAVQSLQIDIALSAYRQCDEVALVQVLESIAHIEDYNLLAGYVCTLINDYDKAQSWFLQSSNPSAALEMRRDLLQWDQALQLSKKMDPGQVCFIAREYAQQLEFIGNYAEAYTHYEKALQEYISAEHNVTCKSGLARNAIRCNNYKIGIDIATSTNNKQLYKDCAEALESKKQYGDAALLYEKSEAYEKAATNYIRLKNWPKVGALLPNINSNKILLQYAKARETEGKYEEAAKSYYAAKDFDSVVRLQLDYLNNPEAAVELIQETKSVEGAKMVARFFQQLNDYPSAIRFLVLSQCQDEAFELAKKHGKLKLLGEVMLNALTPEEMKPQDFLKLATHFELEQNILLAGKYYFHAREYHKALQLLFGAAKSNSNESEALSIAIDVVASSKDEALATQLIDFLLGEIDGVIRDPKYLFRLYMARKQYKEAAKSAIVIASEEQINGNYRNAHDILFNMYQELKQNNIKIPQEMYLNLMLLHSYILVRIHVQKGDHLKGAKMLVRVAKSISKFPSHVVPILTSTVIECHRAGLRALAFEFAAKLIQNADYRKQIDPKYAKKIEGVVRKNGKNGDAGADPPANFTPCPFCEHPVNEIDTTCSNCKSSIPFCIATMQKNRMKIDA